METKNILELSVDSLMEFFGKGRFATVIFTKKNGEERTLTGKAFVDKDINGSGPAYNARDYGQLRLFDVNVKNNDGERVGGWRTVTVANVKEVISDNVRYLIR